MLRTTKDRFPIMTVAGMLLFLVCVAGASFAASQPPFQVQTVLYQGTAYGVQASLGSSLIVGPTGLASLDQPCGTNNDHQTVTGTAAGVNVLPIVQGGASNTSVSSSPTQTSQASSDVTSVNLLAGLITAQEVKSVSTTNLDSNGFHLSAAGSTFNNLSILGVPIIGTPAPNTQIDLPGIGNVVLNEQTQFVNGTEAQLTVNMIHVRITVTNLLGIAPGTEIVISSASSGLVRAFAPAVITGFAYGTQVNVADIITSSPTAPVQLPCYGTAGQVITNSVAGVNLPGILNSGTVTNTGKSALTFPFSTGEMTSQVEGLNLLSGLVTANVIYGRVDATITPTNGVFKTAVATLAGISVAGHPEINDNVPYNTNINLAGLGTLYIKRVIRMQPHPSTIEIRVIELVVNQENVYGLPIGADIVIGDAHLGIVAASEP